MLPVRPLGHRARIALLRHTCLDDRIRLPEVISGSIPGGRSSHDPGGTDHANQWVDVPQFDKMSGGFRFLQGAPPQAPDDLIVDEYYARQNKLHVGQTI